jgi:protein SCO1/2
MEGASAPDPSERGQILSRTLVTILLLALVAGGLTALWSLKASYARRQAELPVLGQLPAFSLTERSGRMVTRNDLMGRPWVADFIFTRCTGICPLLSARMAGLQEFLDGRPDVTLVSISVDPQYDTPEVLARYADRHGADPDRWLFLTGEWEAIRTLVGEGFMLGVSRAKPGEVPDGELVTHSDRLVLVDGEGRIRGFYHGTEDDSVERLEADLERVARGG